jgi:hypothetical protein
LGYQRHLLSSAVVAMAPFSFSKVTQQHHLNDISIKQP